MTEPDAEKLLTIVGLGADPSEIQQMFRVSLDYPDKVTTINTFPFYIQSESAACVIEDVMYVMGAGKSPYKELSMLNKSGEWQKLADMIAGRRRHCVTVIDSTIYVLGGWRDADERTLDGVMSYNTVTNTWSTTGKLVHAVECAASVNHNNVIYLFGGTESDNRAAAYVQEYTPTNNNCSLMSSPMPCAYNLLRAVLWNTSAILLGRWNCVIYDFEKQTWQERKQFKTDVVHFGLVLHRERIYVAGGGFDVKSKEKKITWTNTDEIRSVPVVDIVENKSATWKLHAEVPQPGNVDAFGVMR